jgi:tRNA pseudouridine38-40 synthase
MPRYRLTIEYDGTGYVGWQRQGVGRSIQGAIEAAVLAFAGEAAAVAGSGRTDAGVHALGQVAHLDLSRAWRTDVVRDALNARLKLADDRVSILAAEVVDDAFDARFRATRRHYLYRIMDRRPPPALDRLRAWHVPRRLDERAMDAAAKRLLGRHDFTTFRSADCQSKSPVKTLDVLDVRREDWGIAIETNARSFLHSQVRSLAGSLVEVGLGRWDGDELARRLEARDRAACGPVAPPWGLYFMRVEY